MITLKVVYTEMTIPQLKQAIDARLSERNVIERPYNSKTKKDALIDWLEKDDRAIASLREAMKAATVKRMSVKEKTLNYAKQNGHSALTVAQKRQIRKTQKREAWRVARDA